MEGPVVECLPSMGKPLVPSSAPQRDKGGLELARSRVGQRAGKGSPVGEGSMVFPQGLRQWLFSLIHLPCSDFPIAPRTLTLHFHSEGPWSSWHHTQD